MTDQIAFDFAGFLANEYYETMSIFACIECGNGDNRELLRRMRKVKLEEVDIIERRLGIEPRTAEIRARWKDSKR